LGASGELAPLLQKYAASLPALFIVSQADVVPIGAQEKAGEPATLSVEIKRADGRKCDRCWNYSTHVGESAEYPTVCERCLAALAEIRPGGEVETGKPL
jgi:isoleucyl-tRNA synthetase